MRRVLAGQQGTLLLTVMHLDATPDGSAAYATATEAEGPPLLVGAWLTCARDDSPGSTTGGGEWLHWARTASVIAVQRGAGLLCRDSCTNSGGFGLGVTACIHACAALWATIGMSAAVLVCTYRPAAPTRRRKVRGGGQYAPL